MFLYNLRNNDKLIDSTLYLEKQLIYYLTLGIFHNGKIINSQLKYLYNLLLNKDFDEKCESLTEMNRLCLGLTKSEVVMNNLINSYQTQHLCFDIN